MDYKKELEKFYAEADNSDHYELRWGYVNPVAAAYWRLRDELVFESIVEKFTTFSDLSVLEIGSGFGHELAKFSHLGIREEKLTGIDLVFKRLIRAGHTYPSINFSCQDGVRLAFAEESFDIVCQFTCFMHAPTKEIQYKMGQEIARVLKPGGIVIWWDIAPTQWRTLALKRKLKILSDKKIGRAFSLARDLVSEGLILSRRKKALEKSLSTYILSVSKQEIVKMFPGFGVHAEYKGVDFDIWEYLWKRNRSLAQIVWRTGWFWQHCFGVIEKPKTWTNNKSLDI